MRKQQKTIPKFKLTEERKARDSSLHRLEQDRSGALKFSKTICLRLPALLERAAGHA